MDDRLHQVANKAKEVLEEAITNPDSALKSVQQAEKALNEALSEAKSQNNPNHIQQVQDAQNALYQAQNAILQPNQADGQTNNAISQAVRACQQIR